MRGITYELAKELKDAGFPQPEGHKDYRGLFLNSDNEIDSRWESDAVYVPTLEELIEACGDFKFTLVHAQDGWYAETRGTSSTGTTSADAVARLWLALNKK